MLLSHTVKHSAFRLVKLGFTFRVTKFAVFC